MSEGRPKAEREFTVYFFDTDAGGVAHNLTYLRWIEAARTDLAERLGWGIGDMVGGEHGCPVLTKTEGAVLGGIRGDPRGRGLLSGQAGAGFGGSGEWKTQALTGGLEKQARVSRIRAEAVGGSGLGGSEERFDVLQRVGHGR
ncbi:MAG: acyl-CoA thioesterase [Verrucomicrobia bacterium]|nr:acyl-CoA thioesterase [Verrucomicrobiota bacterium]